MWKLVPYLLVGVLSSFYLFPIEFKFLPEVNTKMIMAGIGICLFFCNSAKRRFADFDLGLIKIIIFGFAVSCVGFLSIAINNTNDYTYATYFVSMFVWLGGAYTMLECIFKAHGHISVLLICNYLIAVCIGQCISALLIEYIPSFNDFINSFVLGVGFASDFSDLQGSRMYGVGAMLDVAGQRFSAILIMIAWMVTLNHVQKNKIQLAYYLLSFIFIVIVGNMIGRTTTVGALIAIAYWVWILIHRSRLLRKVVATLVVILCIVLPIVVYLYNTNSTFNSKTQFAFEGFFSIASTGTWETHSNNILQSMVRMPEKASTWLIGDGYFNNPAQDPYYIGYMWKGFYMGTDIGYLRFIYYFGLLGLLSFTLYFISIGIYLSEKLPNYRTIFWGIILLNFVVWFKVSSDLFSILALFILLPFISDPNHLSTNQKDCNLTHSKFGNAISTF